MLMQWPLVQLGLQALSHRMGSSPHLARAGAEHVAFWRALAECEAEAGAELEMLRAQLQQAHALQNDLASRHADAMRELLSRRREVGEAQLWRAQLERAHIDLQEVHADRSALAERLARAERVLEDERAANADSRSAYAELRRECAALARERDEAKLAAASSASLHAAAREHESAGAAALADSLERSSRELTWLASDASATAEAAGAALAAVQRVLRDEAQRAQVHGLAGLPRWRAAADEGAARAALSGWATAVRLLATAERAAAAEEENRSLQAALGEAERQLAAVGSASRADAELAAATKAQADAELLERCALSFAAAVGLRASPRVQLPAAFARWARLGSARALAAARRGAAERGARPGAREAALASALSEAEAEAAGQAAALRAAVDARGALARGVARALAESELLGAELLRAEAEAEAARAGGRSGEHARERAGDVGVHDGRPAGVEGGGHGQSAAAGSQRGQSDDSSSKQLVVRRLVSQFSGRSAPVRTDDDEDARESAAQRDSAPRFPLPASSSALGSGAGSPAPGRSPLAEQRGVRALRAAASPSSADARDLARGAAGGGGDTLRRHVDLLHLQLLRHVDETERHILTATAAGETGVPPAGAPPRARVGPPRPHSFSISGTRSTSSSSYASPAGRVRSRSSLASPSSSALSAPSAASDTHAASVARRAAARAALAAYSAPRAEPGVGQQRADLQRHADLLHLQLMGPLSDEERRAILRGNPAPVVVAGGEREGSPHD